MKKRFALLIILSMLVTGFAGASSYIIEDDIYYNPNDKNPVVEQKEKEEEAEKEVQKAQAALQEEAPVQKTLMVTADSNFRDVDEYNRRGDSADMTLQDVAANQTENYVEYNIVDENGDDGYYLNGFTGSDSDYEYALRIRRFHNPKFVVSVSDPFYSDIYFLDNNDWNVYITDNYAWVTPTWTNPWYWDYMWSPYSYTSWSWRWTLGPWGFSFGYDPFYYSWGGYWGWNSWYRPPYFHHSFYHHHYPYYGWNNHYRPQYTPNGRQPNRNGGSFISSSASSSSGRRATVGTSSSNSTAGRRTVGTATSSSNGSVTGVRTNRGTIINNSTTNTNRGYRFEGANSSRRGSTSSSGSVSVPSSSQSRRQTSINNSVTNSSRNNYNSVGNSGTRRSYNSATPSTNRNSGYSSSSSSSRRSSGSFSSSSSSSSRGSSSSARGGGSSGRGGRR